ncbi:hypothetical protein Acsp04_27900 [Actinomadura sp. NBRC 104425]|nr:hypothetical protein Acsp04_27900 [Actinomadura sp. NBRC 104425]
MSTFRKPATTRGLGFFGSLTGGSAGTVGDVCGASAEVLRGGQTEAHACMVGHVQTVGDALEQFQLLYGAALVAHEAVDARLANGGDGGDAVLARPRVPLRETEEGAHVTR